MATKDHEKRGVETSKVPERKSKSGSRRDGPSRSGALLNQTARYALRVISQLALSDGNPLRAADLTEHINVPPHYLAKVLRRLVQAELLHSKKGHGGGFVLARPAEEITVRTILEAVDAMPDRDCVFGWEECKADAPCPLHDFWRQAHERFFDWAEAATFGAGGAARRPPDQG